ncbi:hypothetical protein ACJQWK_09838 [Exserohilum turcicum]
MSVKALHAPLPSYRLSVFTVFALTVFALHRIHSYSALCRAPANGTARICSPSASLAISPSTLPLAPLLAIYSSNTVPLPLSHIIAKPPALISDNAMALPRDKSRAQTHNQHTQHQGENSTHYVERVEPEQTDKLGRSSDSDSTLYIFPIEIDGVLYGDPAQPATKKETCFPKRRLSIEGEYETSGAQSKLHTGASLTSTFDPGSLGARPEPMDDDDPSDSLLIEAPLSESESEEAPLSEPASEDPECTTQSQSHSESHSVVQQGKPHQLPKSWHDWIVELFAGRKAASNASSKTTTWSSNKTTCSIACSTTSNGQASLPSMTSNEDNTNCTPPQQPPRLPLSSVIPSVRVPMPPRIAHRLRYVEILPAPMTVYTGYAVVAPDVFNPQIVERGFNVPKTGPATAPAATRRHDPNSRLLDRNGNTWAVWNQRNATAADLPFARTPPTNRSSFAPSNDKTARKV